MSPIPLYHQVDAAMVGVIDGVERIMDGKTPAIHIRKRMRFGYSAIKSSADGKHRITDRFCIQAAT